MNEKKWRESCKMLGRDNKKEIKSYIKLKTGHVQHPTSKADVVNCEAQTKRLRMVFAQDAR
jgi:hypothetical protein